MAAEKTYDFILIFKSKGHALINRISRMMLLLSVAVVVFASLPLTKRSIVPLVVAATVLACWIWIERRIRKGKPTFFRFALLFAAVGWYLQPDGKILAIVYLVAALLEKQVKFPQEVAFDEDEIIFNTFPRKHFDWSAVNNIVLKDGMLTIDFKTNRLIQKELESFPTAKEEAEFNAFCQANISAN